MDAFDAFGAVFATERETGHVGVFAAAGDTLIKDVAIPAGELGHVRAAAISKDFQWLAVSERSRGAVWDLRGKRRVAYVRGFNGAYFDDSGLFFADMPAVAVMPAADIRAAVMPAGGASVLISRSPARAADGRPAPRTPASRASRAALASAGSPAPSRVGHEGLAPRP